MRIPGILAFSLCAYLAAAGAFAVPAWESELKAELNRMADRLTETLKPWPVPDRTFRVEEHGAVADGTTLNTEAIQKAIDACSAAGGGLVLCAKGDYVTGTLELKDGVMLEVAKGSRILGSTRLEDYPARPAARPNIMTEHYKMSKSLIYAENRERIGIRGEGVIDGRGTRENFPGQETKVSEGRRPFLMRIIDCRKVVMSGITLRDAASWLQDYLACDDLILQGLRVENQSNMNNDGIDIDGCRNVIIRDCFVNSEDDGMCFKGASLRTTENVLVENCTFYSACNALKFGTDSQGGFRNVVIRNIEVGGTPAEMNALVRRPAHSGISWEAVDGGDIENILCSNIRVVRARAPIFLLRGDRGRVMSGQPRPAPGKLRRLIFEQITGQEIGSLGAAIITGIPGFPVEDVVLRDLKFPVAGNGTEQNAKPEYVNQYPNAPMFGLSPAYGIWVRHARNISIFNIAITPQSPDARPLFCVDAAVEGATLDGAPLPGNPPL